MKYQMKNFILDEKFNLRRSTSYGHVFVICHMFYIIILPKALSATKRLKTTKRE